MLKCKNYIKNRIYILCFSLNGKQYNFLLKKKRRKLKIKKEKLFFFFLLHSNSVLWAWGHRIKK